MRYLSILILACASCAPVPAIGIELVGDKIVATPEERHILTQCHRLGGCFVASNAQLEVMVEAPQQQIIEIAARRAAELVHEARQSCRRSGT